MQLKLKLFVFPDPKRHKKTGKLLYFHALKRSTVTEVSHVVVLVACKTLLPKLALQSSLRSTLEGFNIQPSLPCNKKFTHDYIARPCVVVM